MAAEAAQRELMLTQSVRRALPAASRCRVAAAALIRLVVRTVAGTGPGNKTVTVEWANSRASRAGVMIDYGSDTPFYDL